jgi:hypothetical protein
LWGAVLSGLNDDGALATLVRKVHVFTIGEVTCSLTIPAHALFAERCDLFDRDETVKHLSVLSWVVADSSK